MSSSQPLRSTVPPEKPEFGDRYELIKKLGVGGMGAVYQANDKALKKMVAMKIMLPGLSNETVIRFQHEAKAAAKLDHPNVVKVLDFGQTPSGDLYLVMDFVAGASLEERIKKEGTLSVATAVPIFINICSGLAHAHSHGVLHRDVKPSNIMLHEEADGCLEIVDFGLAKLQSDDQKLTTTGVRVGSPFYMSPEQASGADVDVRSDIYSLGCLMYKALTGAPPLAGDTYMETILKQQEEEAPPLSENTRGITFPEELEMIVAKALAKDPEDRFQNADELKQALLEFQEWFEAQQIQTKGDDESSSVQLDNALKVLRRFWYITVPVVIFSIGFPLKVVFVDFANKQHVPKHRPKPKMRAVHDIIGDMIDPTDTTQKFHREFEYDPQARRMSWQNCSKSSAFKEACDADPELEKALADGRLAKLYLEEDRAKLWYHPEYQRIMFWDMQELWGDSSLAQIWKDPECIRFIETPRLFHKWSDDADPEIANFKENPRVRQMLADGRFTALFDSPVFVKLAKEKQFHRMIEDQLYIKLRRARAEYERRAFIESPELNRFRNVDKGDFGPMIDRAFGGGVGK